MDSNEKETFLTKAKNLFKKNNYFWTKIASAVAAAIVVIILIVSLATCSGHKHTYATTWSYDDTNHYHEATCKHTSKVSDKEKHTFGDWVVVSEATTSTKGSKKRTCTVCSYVETQEIAVIPHTHTLVAVAKVDATCTTDGMKAYYKCSSCNKLYTDEAGTIETTLEALKIAASHALVHHEAVSETSTENGSIEYWSCSVCDKYFSDANATTEITDKSSVVLNTYSKGLAYTLSEDGNSYIVSGIGTCTDTDIIIPSTNEGKPVTSIVTDAFRDNTTIKTVVIPDSVTTLGNSIFYGCTSLERVEIGAGITSLADYSYMFSNCTSLNKLVFSKNLTYIGSMTFSYTGWGKVYAIYFKGTKDEWNISIHSANDLIDGGSDRVLMIKYYYSESEPTDTENNYWHYVDGVPTAWANS